MLAINAEPHWGQVVTRSYDALDRLSAVQDWLGHTTRFAYDAANNLSVQSYPNGITATDSYNSADELTGIVDRSVAGPFWTYGYGRDAVGQVRTATDPLEGISHTYSYDAQNRLSGEQRSSGGGGQWQYNAAHDLAQSGDPTRPLTTSMGYDAADQLTSLSIVSGTQQIRTYTLSYNADGDRLSQVDSVSATYARYGYDQADRLITTTNSSVSSASYSYDGDGLRQSKTVGSTTTQQTWDSASGALPLLAQDGGTRYITGPEGRPVEQVGADGTALYYVQDQLGSTRGLLNQAGQGVATYTYGPYGALSSRTGTVLTPLGYAGQYTDAESGLQYLRARYYDPATSQFLTRDPAVAQTKQPYAYTQDNPLNGTDPSGLCLWFDSQPCRDKAAQGVEAALTAISTPAYGPASEADLETLELWAERRGEGAALPWARALLGIDCVDTLIDSRASLQDKLTAALYFAPLGRVAKMLTLVKKLGVLKTPGSQFAEQAFKSAFMQSQKLKVAITNFLPGQVTEQGQVWP